MHGQAERCVARQVLRRVDDEPPDARIEVAPSERRRLDVVEELHQLRNVHFDLDHRPASRERGMRAISSSPRRAALLTLRLSCHWNVTTSVFSGA